VYAKDKIALWKKDPGLPDFFFQDTVKHYSELTRLVSTRFNELFESSGEGGYNTIGRSTLKIIIKSAESRFLIWARIKSEFGIDANRVSLYEYFLLLEQLEKINRKWQKQ